MLLRSPVAVPPDPLAGPRTIGAGADYVRFDPANADYALAGTGRPTRRLAFHSLTGLGAVAYNVGTVSSTDLATNSQAASVIPAVQVAADVDGGWRSFVFNVPEWCDVAADGLVVVPVQAVAAASGNLALSVNWDRARDGAVGVSEGSASNVIAGPTTTGQIAFLAAGTIAGGTFAVGDVVSVAIQRLGASDAQDTYDQDIVMARFGWIEFKRGQL